MEKVFKLGHISDIHISRQYYRERIKSLKVLLREMKNDGVDHLIVSGDIVSTADENDYYLTREIFSSAGFLSAERLTVVPGNHDIFGGPHRAVDIVSFPQHIRTVDYMKHLSLFQNAFAETFDSVHCLSTTGLFPFIKIVHKFAILGLNSISPWSLWKNVFGTNGAIDENHYEALTNPRVREFLKDKIPIVVLHHQFNEIASEEYNKNNGIWLRVESKTMRMRKRRKLLRLFEVLGVRYVFHGHIHRNELYKQKGILFANGAGAVCDDPVRFLKYNLLEYSDEVCSIKIKQLPIPYAVPAASQPLYNGYKAIHLPSLAVTIENR